MTSLNGWSTCLDAIAALPAGVSALLDSTVIITGGTSGIGVETSLQLASLCGCLVLAARDAAKAAALISECKERCPEAHVLHVPCDLSSLASVKEFISIYRKKAADDALPPLRYLVLNAGVMCFSYQESNEGFEKTFAVSHLAHFFLATELLPELRAAAPSRVISVSSGSHFGPLSTWTVSTEDSLRAHVVNPGKKGWGYVKGITSYGSAKLCNAIFAQALHDRHSAEGVSSCSLHPGTLMATELGRESAVGRFFLGSIMSWFTKSMDQGSATTLSCCLRKAEELRGLYFDNCQVATSSTRVQDKQNQDTLWDLSEQLCQPFRTVPCSEKTTI